MTALPTPVEHRTETGSVVDRSNRHAYRTTWWWRCSCMPPETWHQAPTPEAAESAAKTHRLLGAMS